MAASPVIFSFIGGIPAPEGEYSIHGKKANVALVIAAIAIEEDVATKVAQYQSG